MGDGKQNKANFKNVALQKKTPNELYTVYKKHISNQVNSSKPLGMLTNLYKPIKSQNNNYFY